MKTIMLAEDSPNDAYFNLVKDADPLKLAVGVRVILNYWLFAGVTV